MGRKPEIITKNFISSNGDYKEIEVELFTWEKLDYRQDQRIINI